MLRSTTRVQSPPLLLLSRSLVDIKVQQLPPASLVHDILSFASCCSVLDTELVARRQISKHRPRASQWWAITNSGTARPVRGSRQLPGEATGHGHPPQAHQTSPDLLRPGKTRIAFRARFLVRVTSHPTGVSIATSTASKQPINIERAESPWAPGSGQNRRLCTHSAAILRSTAARQPGLVGQTRKARLGRSSAAH